jgi:hypothetical protein
MGAVAADGVAPAGTPNTSNLLCRYEIDPGAKGGFSAGSVANLRVTLKARIRPVNLCHGIVGTRASKKRHYWLISIGESFAAAMPPDRNWCCFQRRRVLFVERFHAFCTAISIFGGPT